MSKIVMVSQDYDKFTFYIEENDDFLHSKIIMLDGASLLNLLEGKEKIIAKLKALKGAYGDRDLGEMYNIGINDCINILKVNI